MYDLDGGPFYEAGSPSGHFHDDATVPTEYEGCDHSRRGRRKAHLYRE